MPLSPSDWRDRFRIQAQWTEELRLYFFGLIQDADVSRVLDIGCGTGALLADLDQLTSAEIFGADLNLDYLRLARSGAPSSSLLGADAVHLPFPDDSIDLVLCHYFLLWVEQPSLVLQEMARVTRPGGIAAAFAEPDYGGRIDHPPEFAPIRDLQISALQQAGADPLMGRKVAALFRETGFIDLESGVYQGSWSDPASPEEIASEWSILSSDLEALLGPGELDRLLSQEKAAREAGTRLIYVPTFFCWGTVP